MLLTRRNESIDGDAWYTVWVNDSVILVPGGGVEVRYTIHIEDIEESRISRNITRCSADVRTIVLHKLIF